MPKSNHSDNSVDRPIPRVPWNPWLGVVFVVAVYFLAQILASLLVELYPLARGWSPTRVADWLNNAVTAQFAYILLAEALSIGSIYLFLRWRHVRWPAIGFKRPQWRDPFYGAVGWVVYFIILWITVTIAGALIPSLNVNQQQQIGFSDVHGVANLVMTGISLVILPPLAEEIMVRGFLYGSLKKGMPQLAAALVTSAIFASAHLPEGGSAGPLYIAAIDTFVLSLVLVYLREKTNSLWAGITVHGLKNWVAFASIYLAGHR